MGENRLNVSTTVADAMSYVSEGGAGISSPLAA